MKTETSFCQTCNARDRVIDHGKCVVCGFDPRTDHGTTPSLWEAAGRDSRLGVDHVWTNTRCPAYLTLDGVDCNCSS